MSGYVIFMHKLSTDRTNSLFFLLKKSTKYFKRALILNQYKGQGVYSSGSYAPTINNSHLNYHCECRP